MKKTLGVSSVALMVVVALIASSGLALARIGGEGAGDRGASSAISGDPVKPGLPQIQREPGTCPVIVLPRWNIITAAPEEMWR